MKCVYIVSLVIELFIKCGLREKLKIIFKAGFLIDGTLIYMKLRIIL